MIVISSMCTLSFPGTSQRMHMRASQVLAKPNQACASLDAIITKNPHPAPDVMVPGTHVKVTWDRFWQWNASTVHMRKTDYEGSQGTIVRMMKCFVWVAVDDTNDVIKKRKHNVHVVAGDH